MLIDIQFARYEKESHMAKDTALSQGGWEVGAYYRSTHTTEVWETFGARIESGVRIPVGTIFTCREILIKDVDYISPDDRRRKRSYAYARLAVFDPRFPATHQRILSKDVAIEHYAGAVGFQKIESPLVILALLADNLLP
jgi:hypothetical protein